jgi:peptide/nickel transport system permease protein
MNAIKNALRETLRYPSAIVGLFLILLMFAVAIYAMVAIPYPEAIRKWRGGEDIWYQNPRFAPPAWFNAFRREKLPVSFAVRSSDGGMTKTVTQADATTSTIDIIYEFDFTYDGYPQEMILYFDAEFDEKQPFASIAWIMPNGEKIRIADTAIERETTFRIAQDTKLMKRLKVEIADEVMRALFLDPETGAPLKGRYTLIVNAVTFEPGADVDAEFVFHGQLFGLAGTDHARRDLTLPLLWGTPVALAFGLIASLGTSILTMVIAAVGAWYAGWVDELIQRITEVNLVLPFLSILIMVGTFYSRSIWVILGVVVLLSIFTGSIKAYRSVFIQVKESGFIEAARAYGASDWRIVFQYLIPRMIPLLIPGLVASVPAFVFLEATLAVLGLGDPVLPTWGKIIEDASSNGALYKGYYYWVLEPAILLMVTGLAFAMLGFALDRIFNPRLREI